MGIMSRNNRLPERPKPPAWAEITEDISQAQDSDVVFLLGREYLTAMTEVTTSLPSTPLPEKTHSTSNISAAKSTDHDMTHIDPEKVRAANVDVSRLIAMYTELTNSPSSLEEQFEHLRHVRDEMSESVLELRKLAQSFSVDESGRAASPARDGAKSKSKQKKKK